MSGTDRILSPAEPETVGLSRAGLERIDAALQAMIDEGQLAGAVTLVGRRGRLAHAKAMGRKDVATGEPLKTDDIFRIFSMTKPVTGAAMMILYEQGLWRPEDPVARFLPALADLDVAARDIRGDLVRVGPDHPPTMAELMTHTAGFSYGFDPMDPVDALYREANPLGAASLAEMVERLVGLPLHYQPGTEWRYSLSMDIQGAIIEALSGQSLPEFMRTRIFDPLGMADTAFHVPPGKRERLATCYRMSARRGLVPLDRPLLGADYDAPPAMALGGGGLFSTAADYARFAQMLLNKGELGGVRILALESVALMTRNHLSDAIMAGGFGVGFQQIRPGYGHAFDGAVFTDPALAGAPVGKGTYQWDGAAGTWFWVDPVNDLLFVGLIQRMALPGSPNLQAITQTLMAEAFV
ncbi:MAG: serine hydrolase [Caulobacteraceae bacterium]|nr:serine hydrolase [Caulobacteraceae bacterium]